MEKTISLLLLLLCTMYFTSVKCSSVKSPNTILEEKAKNDHRVAVNETLTFDLINLEEEQKEENLIHGTETDQVSGTPDHRTVPSLLFDTPANKEQYTDDKKKLLKKDKRTVDANMTIVENETYIKSNSNITNHASIIHNLKKIQKIGGISHVKSLISHRTSDSHNTLAKVKISYNNETRILNKRKKFLSKSEIFNNRNSSKKIVLNKNIRATESNVMNPLTPEKFDSNTQNMFEEHIANASKVKNEARHREIIVASVAQNSLEAPNYMINIKKVKADINQRVARDNRKREELYYDYYDYPEDSQNVGLNGTSTPLETDHFIEKKPRMNMKKRLKVDNKQTLVFPLSEEMIEKVKKRRDKKKMLENQKRNRIRHGMEEPKLHNQMRHCITIDGEKTVCSDSQVSVGDSARKLLFSSTITPNSLRNKPKTLSTSTTAFPYFGPPVTVIPYTTDQEILAREVKLFNHKILLNARSNLTLTPSKNIDNKTSSLYNYNGTNSAFLRIANGGLQTRRSREDGTTEAVTTASEDKWPGRIICEVEGDILLGALMMVHERDDKLTCGKIMPQGKRYLYYIS